MQDRGPRMRPAGGMGVKDDDAFEIMLVWSTLTCRARDRQVTVEKVWMNLSGVDVRNVSAEGAICVVDVWMDHGECQHMTIELLL